MVSESLPIIHCHILHNVVCDLFESGRSFTLLGLPFSLAIYRVRTISSLTQVHGGMLYGMLSNTSLLPDTVTNMILSRSCIVSFQLRVRVRVIVTGCQANAGNAGYSKCGGLST
jgi:hypothetical protein